MATSQLLAGAQCTQSTRTVAASTRTPTLLFGRVANKGLPTFSGFKQGPVPQQVRPGGGAASVGSAIPPCLAPGPAVQLLTTPPAPQICRPSRPCSRMA